MARPFDEGLEELVEVLLVAATFSLSVFRFPLLGFVFFAEVHLFDGFSFLKFAHVFASSCVVVLAVVFR